MYLTSYVLSEEEVKEKMVCEDEVPCGDTCAHSCDDYFADTYGHTCVETSVILVLEIVLV